MEITPAALKAVSALRHAGFDAYPVGGCVRDSLVPLIGTPQNPSDPTSVRAILDCAPSPRMRRRNTSEASSAGASPRSPDCGTIPS